MRLAFLVGTFPALTKTFVLDQITGLLDRDHQIDIYSTRKGNFSKMHSEIKDYKLLERTYYLGITKIPRNKLLRILKASFFILINFRKNPLAILNALNFVKYGKRALSLELLYIILPFIGKKPYDIIHCHFGNIGTLGVLFKEIGAIEGKTVISFYGFDVSYYTKNNKKAYEQLLDKKIVVIALSEYMKKQLIDLGFNKNFIVIHPLGIHLEEFPFKERRLPKKRPLRILTVARLTEKKGLEYSIRAFAKVAKTYNIKYTIVGDGVLRPRIEKLITDLKMTDKIEIAGWKERTELKTIFEKSDIFVLPSVTAINGDQEGTPTVLLEAMSSGLPVISTYHAGIPEMIKDGKSGFLVPERNIEVLAKRILSLIEHPEIWQEFGSAGRKYVEENHDIEKLNDRLEKIYIKLIERNS